VIPRVPVKNKGRAEGDRGVRGRKGKIASWLSGEKLFRDQWRFYSRKSVEKVMEQRRLHRVD